MQHRRIDRPDLQFDIAGVAKLLCQRNILPAEFRCAHVDSVEIRRRSLPAAQKAGAGLEGDRGLSGLLEQPPHHAAHAVAAGTCLRAVIIVDADEGLGTVEPCPLQYHELIIGHTGRRGDGACLLWRHRSAHVAQIDHDDLVADAVHLGKCVIGERAHEISRFMPALYGQ